jgi:hypothetical protein
MAVGFIGAGIFSASIRKDKRVQALFIISAHPEIKFSGESYQRPLHPEILDFRMRTNYYER